MLVIPAYTGIQPWIPVCTGMTVLIEIDDDVGIKRENKAYFTDLFLYLKWYTEYLNLRE